MYNLKYLLYISDMIWKIFWDLFWKMFQKDNRKKNEVQLSFPHLIRKFPYNRQQKFVYQYLS